MRFSGKTALVTGGASGIGLAVKQSLEDEGARVVSVDLHGERPFDVTREADWNAMEVHPDILVASAGISLASPLAETRFEDWRKVLSVNLDGVFLAMRYGLRRMREGGCMVVIGSASGVKVAAGAAAYCTSKAGVRMLVRSAAAEAKPLGIRVNSVAPAGVVTPIWEGMPFFQQMVAEQGEEAAWAALGGRNPDTPALHRMALPEEIAKAVLFLCSDESSGVTGTELIIDGGYTL